VDHGFHRLSAFSIIFDFEHPVTEIKTNCDKFMNGGEAYGI
jgi:hypothetical protein